MPGPFDLEHDYYRSRANPSFLPGMPMDSISGTIAPILGGMYLGNTVKRAAIYGSNPGRFTRPVKSIFWGSQAMDKSLEASERYYRSTINRYGFSAAQAEGPILQNLTKRRLLRGGGIGIRASLVRQELMPLYRAGTLLRGAAGAFFLAGDLMFAADIGRWGAEAVLNWKPKSIAPPMMGTQFMDTRGAFTMRQRAIQAIHDSQLSTRAALGNEASFMHY